MAIVIDGIVLPDIPEGTFDDVYKYGIIYYNVALDKYYLMVSKGPIIYIPSELSPLNGESFMMFNGEGYKECSFDGVGNWASFSESPYAFFYGTPEGAVLWANHDIKTAAELNMETGEIISFSDELFFPNSEAPAEPDVPDVPEEPEEPEPEYGKIRRAIIRGASNAVRRKTGRTDKFPPEQLEYEIDSIVTADNALVLKDNERIYQVGSAETIWSFAKNAFVSSVV